MGRDTHAFVVQNDNQLVEGLSVDGAGYSEAIKCSNRHGVVIRDCNITGGSEDCIDIVRGSNYTIEDCRFVRGKAKQELTIKGGVNWVRLVGLKFKDCVLGQYTIYDHTLDQPPCRNVSLDNCEGRVWVWHSDRPAVTNSRVRVIVLPSIIVRAWFWINAKILRRKP